MTIEISVTEIIDLKIRTLEEENAQLKYDLKEKEKISNALKLSVDNIFREKSELVNKYKDLEKKYDEAKWQLLIIGSALRNGKV